MSNQDELDDLARIADDVGLLRALDLPPLAHMALDRITARLKRLDVAATARFIEGQPPCQDSAA